MNHLNFLIKGLGIFFTIICGIIGILGGVGILLYLLKTYTTPMILLCWIGLLYCLGRLALREKW